MAPPGGACFDLGQRALLAAAKHTDGRGAGTGLTTALLRATQLTAPPQLMAWAYGTGAGGGSVEPPAGSGQAGLDAAFKRVASLAPTVVECARRGDAVADTILRHCVGELVRCAPLLCA